jgi:hypothetical protein
MKLKRFLICMMMFSALPAFSQDKPAASTQAPPSKPAAETAVKSPQAPVISPELRAKYWKTQTDLVAANAQQAQANTAAQAVFTELTAACGSNAALMPYFNQQNPNDPQNRDPICVLKPPPEKAEKKDK